MRIHGNVTRDVAIAISRIKKLLVKHFGKRYEDTGQVLSYCVSCTVQQLNEFYKKEQENVKVQMGAGIPADIQDEVVGGGGPESQQEDGNTTVVDAQDSSGDLGDGGE